MSLLCSTATVGVEAALFFLLQDTRVRAGELDQAPGRPFTLSISNQYGNDEVTHTLQTESREALQSWMEALWQLFFDMSKREGSWVEPLGGPDPSHFYQMEWMEGNVEGERATWLSLPVSALPAGQWKQCCDEIMKIETPAPRKPPQAMAKQGSLYHEMGE